MIALSKEHSFSSYHPSSVGEGGRRGAFPLPSSPPSVGGWAPSGHLLSRGEGVGGAFPTSFVVSERFAFVHSSYWPGCGWSVRRLTSVNLFIDRVRPFAGYQPYCETFI